MSNTEAIKQEPHANAVLGLGGTNIAGGTTYVPSPPTPCPTCGRCPTCGHAPTQQNYPSYPFWYVTNAMTQGTPCR
jgi:hypothetical protein